MSQRRGRPPLESGKPFEGVLGTTTELAVVQHIIATREIPFTQAEIAESTNRSRQAVGKALKKLEGWGFLKSVQHGNQIHYALDEASGLAFAIDTLNGALIEKITGIEVIHRHQQQDILADWREREHMDLAAWRSQETAWKPVSKKTLVSP